MSSRPEVRFLDRSTPPHIFTLVLIAGLSALNMSAFLPALPSMTAYFQTEYSVMQLSVSLYLAATAVLQLMIGPLSDRFGRRRVVLVSIVGFVAATLGCIVAPNVETFLVFRVLQASIATGIVLSRAVVRDMVPQDEAASMIGYVTMGMAMVPMIAPMIGGALQEVFGWQSIFQFLILLAAFVFAMVFLDMGETVRGKGVSFRQQLHDYPELLTSPRFWGYTMAAAFASGAFFAFLGGAPYVATEIFGLSSFWSGAGFGAPAIGYATGNFISGRFSTRFGINRMILAGSIITCSGLAVAALIVAAGFDTPLIFFGFCTTVGLGNGLLMPNASAGQLSVRPHLAGTASGLGGTIMIGGGAALSALAGAATSDTSLTLILLMLLPSLASLGAILYVYRRERTLGLR